MPTLSCKPAGVCCIPSISACVLPSRHMSLTDLPFCTSVIELIAFCCGLLVSLSHGEQQEVEQEQREQKVWQGVPVA